MTSPVCDSGASRIGKDGGGNSVAKTVRGSHGS